MKLSMQTGLQQSSQRARKTTRERVNKELPWPGDTTNPLDRINWSTPQVTTYLNKGQSFCRVSVTTTYAQNPGVTHTYNSTVTDVAEVRNWGFHTGTFFDAGVMTPNGEHQHNGCCPLLASRQKTPRHLCKPPSPPPSMKSFLRCRGGAVADRGSHRGAGGAARRAARAAAGQPQRPAAGAQQSAGAGHRRRRPL